MKTLAFLIALTATVAADKAPVRPRADEHTINCAAKCWYERPFTDQERKRFFRIGGNLVTL